MWFIVIGYAVFAIVIALVTRAVILPPTTRESTRESLTDHQPVSDAEVFAWLSKKRRKR